MLTTLGAWVGRKFVDRYYYACTKVYKRTKSWANHPLNPKYVEVPATDPDRLDEELKRKASELGYSFEDYEIDATDYEEFKKRCHVPSYYAVGFREKKLLEHYISYRLLELSPSDVYMDIASEASPFPEIFRKRFAVDAYSQDLTYPAGVHGRRIGSSANCIPVDDCSFDKVSMQCAFEHFAGDVDSGCMREMYRVLRPAGRCVIVPLYVGGYPLNIIDPVRDHSWVHFDAGAIKVAELNLGGNYERVYSPDTLNRIIWRDAGLSYVMYRIRGIEGITSDPYSAAYRVRFALLIEKEAGADA